MDLTELYTYGMEAKDTDSNCSDNQCTRRFMALMHCYNDNYKKDEIKQYIEEHFLLRHQTESEINYNNLKKQVETQVEAPAYHELPLSFIQTAPETYFVMNCINNTLTGPVTIPVADTIEDDTKVNYQPILVDGHWNLAEYVQFFSINQYGAIYLTLADADARLNFYSMLQIKEVGSYLKDHHKLYLYPDTNSLFEDLKNNCSLPLPQNIICVQEGNLMQELTAHILEIHTDRIHKPKTEKPLLSICIPTYNRGKLALGKLKELQCLTYDTELEFVISNNGSTKEQAEYQLIEEQTESDHRLQYNHYETNHEFLGNFWKVIQMSSAAHALLISDEDHVIPSSLPHYIGLLLKYPEVGIIRSSGNCFYVPDQMDNCYQKAGSDALQYFFLGNNYLSGIIYRTSVVPVYLPDEYNKIFTGNEAFRHYPHEFLDMFLCNRYDFISDKLPLFLCGEAQIYEEYTEKNGQLTYQTRESRLLQLIGFTELINHMIRIDDLTRLNLYVAACKKTLFLLELNLAKDDIWNDILDEFRSYCLKAYQTLQMEHKDLIGTAEIESLIEEFIADPIY